MSPLASPRVSEAFAEPGAGYDYFATEAHYRSVAARIATGFRAAASTILVTGEPIADARRLAEALHETGVWQKAVTLSSRSNLEPNQHVTATDATGHRDVAAQSGATPVVVVLDDVDQLSDEQLLEFHRSRRLDDRRITNAVLLASPAFVARLEKPELAGLKLGPGSRIPFQHLGTDEVEAFICHQLPPDKRELVTKDGVSAIANASGGDPALVNRLADVMLQYKARARGKSEPASLGLDAPEHSVANGPGPSQRNTEHAPGPPSGEPRHPRESDAASSGGQGVQSARDGAVMGSKRSKRREGASSVAQAVQGARAAVGAERTEKGGPDWSSEHAAQDAHGGALKGAEASGSIPTTSGVPEADEAVPRAVSLRAFGSDQPNKDFTEHGRAANHVQAGTARSEEVPGNFFANTAPRKVELGFENAPPSVPERIGAKLQLSRFGKPGTPESVKEAPQMVAEPVASPVPAERRWRRSTRALVLVAILALLAVGMGGFDSLWRVYGSQVEQVMLASGGQVVTWLPPRPT